MGELRSTRHRFELEVVVGGLTAWVAGLVFTDSLLDGAGGQAQFHVTAPRLVEVVLFADAVDPAGGGLGKGEARVFTTHQLNLSPSLKFGL